MGFTKFIQRNWVGLLGLCVGFIGIALSIIFYSRSLAAREPVFLVDPSRTEIIRADRVSAAPLKVIRTDGSKISGDISSVNLYLWNRGKLSIKPEHILQPLRIILDDPKGEILDFQVLKTSRDVVAPELSRAQELPNQILTLKFNILEENDGFCAQVIYVGNPLTSFYISGKIEGVHGQIGSSPVEATRLWAAYTKAAKGFVIAIGLFILFAVLTGLADFFEKKWKVFIMKFRLGRYYLVVKLVLIAAVIIWFALINPLKNARHEAQRSLMESVPSNILPIK